MSLSVLERTQAVKMIELNSQIATLQSCLRDQQRIVKNLREEIKELETQLHRYKLAANAEADAFDQSQVTVDSLKDTLTTCERLRDTLTNLAHAETVRADKAELALSAGIIEAEAIVNSIPADCVIRVIHENVFATLAVSVSQLVDNYRKVQKQLLQYENKHVLYSGFRWVLESSLSAIQAGEFDRPVYARSQDNRGHTVPVRVVIVNEALPHD